MHLKHMLGIIVLLITWAYTPSYVHATESSPSLLLELTDETFLYNTPDMGHHIIRILEPGTRVLWDGVAKRISLVTLMSEAQSAPDVVVSAAVQNVWLQVHTDDVEGWIRPPRWEFTNIYQTTLGLAKGRTGQIVATTELYQSPDFHSNVVAGIQPLVRFIIVDGPVVAQLHSWWKVKFSDRYQGWIPDTLHGLQAVAASVDESENYPVCWGTLGSTTIDAFLTALPAQLGPAERVICLGRAALADPRMPFVAVVTHSASPTSSLGSVTLRIFTQGGADWKEIYRQEDAVFSGHGSLGIFDLTGNGTPMLMWTRDAPGSGTIMAVSIMKYDSVKGLHAIFNQTGIYRGWVQPDVGSFLLVGQESRDISSNCCLDGLTLQGFVWQNEQFVQRVASRVINPAALMMPQDIDIHPLK